MFPGGIEKQHRAVMCQVNLSELVIFHSPEIIRKPMIFWAVNDRVYVILEAKFRAVPLNSFRYLPKWFLLISIINANIPRR